MMRKNIFVLFVFLSCGLLKAQEKEESLSMQEAIDYALENNYDNKIAANDVKAAIKRKLETQAIGLPQLNGAIDFQQWINQQVSPVEASAFGGNEGEYLALAFTPRPSLTPSLTLTQLIFDGSYLVGLQSAKTYLKISEQAKEKTELAVKEAVINAYGNVLVAEKSIEILEGNKKVNDRLLNGAREGFKNGLAEQEDVERFEIFDGNLINSIRNAKQMKEIAYQMLNFSIGKDIYTKLKLTDNLEDLVVKNTSLELIGETLDVENHIDYKIAENSRLSNELLLKLEKSKALPTLGAFATLGATNYFDTFNVVGEGDKNWFGYSLVGASLTVPIFSSFSRSAKTAQAKIELENADIELERTKQQLELQTEQARSNYDLSIANYETAKKNLGLAQRIEKKQQIKFDEGVTTSFQLLQAQQELYTQQNNYVQSMLNVIAKKTTLENALNLPLKK